MSVSRSWGSSPGAIRFYPSGLGSFAPLVNLLADNVLVDVVEIVMTLRAVGFATLPTSLVETPVLFLAYVLVVDAVILFNRG